MHCKIIMRNVLLQLGVILATIMLRGSYVKLPRHLCWGGSAGEAMLGPLCLGGFAWEHCLGGSAGATLLGQLCWGGFAWEHCLVGSAGAALLGQLCWGGSAGADLLGQIC